LWVDLVFSLFLNTAHVSSGMFIFTEKEFGGSIFYASGSLPFLLHCAFRKKKSVLNEEYASKLLISVTIRNTNQT